jgi:hypothetical protein
MFGLLELMGVAASDAALAETLFQDRSLVSDLREDKDVFRTFRVTTLSAPAGRERREIPASWKLRLAPARVRPIL